MVSRVGADELGREIRQAVRGLGLSDAFLQEDADHPTGTVRVALDERGQPAFTITPDVAYDYLAWDESLEELFGRARAVCFGTLVQRHPAARETVRRALRAARNAVVVYDINLRQHYYSREVIEASLAASRWVKLNEDELAVLRPMLALSGATDPAALADLRRRGVEALLSEGGPTLFRGLLEAGLVDELFLTLSPKVSGGAAALTIVAGSDLVEPVQMALLSLAVGDDELFCRWRRRPV
jgi:fructokinase